MPKNIFPRVIYARTQFWFGLKSGGSVTHTTGVVKELQKKGEVEIVGNEALYGLENVPSKIIKPRSLSFLPNTFREFIYNFRFKKYLKKRTLDFKPSFIYHRFSGLSFATARVCQDLNIPFVLEFNSYDSWKLNYWVNDTNILMRIHYWILRKIVKRIERFNLINADLIVVVSRPLKEQLERFGIPGYRILVNPNGVDVDKFKPGGREERMKLIRKLGIPDNAFIFGFSGTFGQWHGIPELTEAIIRFNKHNRTDCEVFFVLFGDGIFREDMQNKTERFNNVLFTGTVEFNQIEEYLDICDILISPHGKTPDGEEFFGSPTKLFEYMAMGKGILASDLGQISEVISHLNNGYLTEPGNVEQLLNGIDYFLNNPNEVGRLGSNARKTVVDHYTWEKNVDRLIAAFLDTKDIGRTVTDISAIE